MAKKKKFKPITFNYKARGWDCASLPNAIFVDCLPELKLKKYKVKFKRYDTVFERIIEATGIEDAIKKTKELKYPLYTKWTDIHDEKTGMNHTARIEYANENEITLRFKPFHITRTPTPFLDLLLAK